MNRRLMIGLAYLAIALGGCATSLATRDDASLNEGSAAPSTASPASRPPSDFGAATIPNFGRQAP